MDDSDPAPPKRKRGRPRKTPPPPVEPEEIIIQAPEEPAPEGEEVIHLTGAEPEPEPEPTPPPPPPDPPAVYLPPPPDVSKEKERRQAALMRIRKYRESFAAVRAMPFNEDGTADELESHLDAVRAAVSTKNTAILVKGAYLAGVKAVEIGTCAAGVKSYGLTEILSRSAEVDNLLKEVACEIGIGHVPAHVRLALATVQTVVVLDSSNRKAEALAGFKKEAVNPELKSRYGDL